MEIKKEYDLTVEVHVKLTEEDIDDIMVAALEGGVNYWCSEAEVIEEKRVADWGHEQIARGGVLILHDIETDDKYDLNLEKFISGVKLWISEGYAFDSGAIDNGTIDCCQVDAIQADNIVQLALFGEIVFA